MANIKLPFPEMFLNNVVTVQAYGQMSEDGSPEILATSSHSCYFEDNVKVIRDEKGIKTKSFSLIVVKEEVPSLTSTFGGIATINSTNYKIEEVKRFFNLDNTVHHIEMVVI